MSQALVSVVIPVYNGEQYLEETLRSICDQTYSNLELIVIDDGSHTDACRKICEKFGEKVRYFHQENRGLSAARNSGLREARGEWIAFIDQDDVWLADKIQKQVTFYRDLQGQGKRPGLVYTGLTLIDASGRESGSQLYRASGIHYAKLLEVDFIGTPSSVLVPTLVLREVGGFDEKVLTKSDWDLWLRVARAYSVYSLDEYLTKYRVTANSLSGDPAKMEADHAYLLDKICAAPNGTAGFSREVIQRWMDREASIRWKNTAYDALFNDADGLRYRELIRRGSALDPRVFDWKAKVYYFFSYLSPKLCAAFRAIKPRGKYCVEELL